MKFLPLAEQTGYIVDIGRHVTRKALSDYAQWSRTNERNRPLFVSTNLSATLQSAMAREFLDMVSPAGVERWPRRDHRDRTAGREYGRRGEHARPEGRLSASQSR